MIINVFDAIINTATIMHISDRPTKGCTYHAWIQFNILNSDDELYLIILQDKTALQVKNEINTQIAIETAKMNKLIKELQG